MEGSGHHLSSYAGPPSMHNTISHLISPGSSSGIPCRRSSLPASSRGPDVARCSVGCKLHIWMHAFVSLGAFSPMSGSWSFDASGPTARYCVKGCAGRGHQDDGRKAERGDQRSRSRSSMWTGHQSRPQAGAPTSKTCARLLGMKSAGGA